MKLVDLLARELESWPKSARVKCLTQDYDGAVNMFEIDNPTSTEGGCWRSYGFIEYLTRLDSVAVDNATAIITREMWQSARDKLKGETAMQKPKGNKDGWIRHRGGKCPVAEGIRVDIRYRGGEPGLDYLYDTGLESQCYEWKHYGEPGDIMAYRIHAPEQPREIKVSVDHDAGVIHAEEVSNSCGTVVAEWHEDQIDGPIKWRDRIREIDSTVEALEEERESLIQRLAEEGFKLLRVDGKAMPKQPELDMGDWRNWEVGDFIVIHDKEWFDYASFGGKPTPITQIDNSDIPIKVGCTSWLTIDRATWHSRPSK